MSDSLTRARAKEAPSVPERVEHIRRMMMRGEWLSRSCTQDLCDAWGLTVADIRKSAAEASRQLAALRSEATLEQMAADREVWLASVERVVSLALAATETKFDRDGVPIETAAPDFRAALAGLEMLARAQGIVLTPSAAQMTATYLRAVLERLPEEMRTQVVAEIRETKLERRPALSGVVVRVEEQGK